jgi:hypothetical protein
VTPDFHGEEIFKAAMSRGWASFRESNTFRKVSAKENGTQ